MATYRSGANTRLMLVKESAYNTPGSVGNLVPISSVGVPGLQELITSDELTPDPNPPANSKGLKTGTGFTATCPVTADSIGLWMYYFFGDYTKSGASAPYTHTFEVTGATDPPSFTAEIGDIGLTKYDQYNGCSPVSIGLSVTKTSDLFRANIGFTGSGKSTINTGTSLDTTPTTYADLRHVLPGILAKVDGTAAGYLTGVDLTITRQVDVLNPLSSNLYGAEQSYRKYAVDCTIRGWRDSGDTLVGLDNDAEHTFELISYRPGGTTRYLSIKFEEAYFLNTEAYTIGDDGPGMYALRVSPFYGNGASASSIVISLLSDVADYAAAT